MSPFFNSNSFCCHYMFFCKSLTWAIVPVGYVLPYRKILFSLISVTMYGENEDLFSNSFVDITFEMYTVCSFFKIFWESNKKYEQESDRLNIISFFYSKTALFPAIFYISSSLIPPVSSSCLGSYIEILLLFCRKNGANWKVLNIVTVNLEYRHLNMLHLKAFGTFTAFIWIFLTIAGPLWSFASNFLYLLL